MVQAIPRPPRDSPSLPTQKQQPHRQRATTIPAALMNAMATWYQQQQASPSIYPETWFATAENVGARRQFDAGQRQATYTPPTQARLAAAPLRQFSQQQRMPAGTTQTTNEAIRQRPANMPLSTSMTRDQILRQAAELASMAAWRKEWDRGRTERARERFP